jgi:hypothetical protein
MAEKPDYDIGKVIDSIIDKYALRPGERLHPNDGSGNVFRRKSDLEESDDEDYKVALGETLRDFTEQIKTNIRYRNSENKPLPSRN